MYRRIKLDVKSGRLVICPWFSVCVWKWILITASSKRKVESAVAFFIFIRSVATGFTRNEKKLK